MMPSKLALATATALSIAIFMPSQIALAGYPAMERQYVGKHGHPANSYLIAQKQTAKKKNPRAFDANYDERKAGKKKNPKGVTDFWKPKEKKKQ